MSTTTEPEGEAEPLLQLCYASAATVDFDDSELVALLEVARANNERAGISGMLLFHEGSFLQVLEGDPAAVEELYARIGEDPRHADAILLFRRLELRPQFSSWTMGFFRVRPEDHGDLEGLNEFLRTGQIPTGETQTEIVRKTLLGFREGRWRRLVDH